VSSSSKILLACVFLLVLSACATSFDKRGRYHKVRSGESIWSIARAYRVDLQGLAEENNIFDPKDVQPGTKLYIPERERKAAFKRLPIDMAVKDAGGEIVEEPEPQKRGGNKYSRDQSAREIKTFRGRFIWPVDGKVTSLFGIRNGRRHDGIDISAKQGAPIKAADQGKCVFSDAMHGYGNLILIRHGGNFFTAYAHNSKNKVKKGQDVKKGQVIGLVGRTGRATGSHLHFEIRHGQRARNPLFFLPERK
jgi:lipoprotein NlpD